MPYSQCTWVGETREKEGSRVESCRGISEGVELYPAGNEQGWMGLPFKYLQGHSSASVSLSLQIQGNLFSFPEMVPKAEVANLNCH